VAIVVNGGGSSGRRRSYGTGSLSEINVTPFVDVVLVLLIIFMMTAHVMEFGLEIEVPKTKYVKDTQKELPVINITRDGELYLNDKATNINLLGTTLQQRYRGQSVFVRADKGTPWDPIAHVLSELKAANISVNMVTQPEDSADKRGR